MKPGALIRSKIDQPYPGVIKTGDEGRAMLNVGSAVWICVFDGHQIHMNESDIEEVAED